MFPRRGQARSWIGIGTIPEGRKEAFKERWQHGAKAWMYGGPWLALGARSSSLWLEHGVCGLYGRKDRLGLRGPGVWRTGRGTGFHPNCLSNVSYLPLFSMPAVTRTVQLLPGYYRSLLMALSHPFLLPPICSEGSRLFLNLFIWVLEQVKLIQTKRESRALVARGGGLTAKEHGTTFWVKETCCVLMVVLAAHWMYTFNMGAFYCF